MPDKNPSLPDFAALAAEACDLWQEQLSAVADNGVARAELMRLLEPSRRLFADWAAMMQTSAHGDSPFTGGRGAQAARSTATASRAAPPGAASDDGALRLAQLTHHVAELERRLVRLESGAGGKVAKDQKRAKRKS